MKKTTDYQLNQWEKTDRIMMDDFNRDNVNTEAAIKAEANRVAGLPHGTLLCGGATEADANQVNLDVSEVDWSRYLMVVLEVRGEEVPTMRLYINGGSDGSCIHDYFGSSAHSAGQLGYLSNKSNVFSVAIPVLYSGDHPFIAINFSLSGTLGLCSKNLDSLTSLTLWFDGNSIAAGTIVQLWGVR